MKKLIVSFILFNLLFSEVLFLKNGIPLIYRKVEGIDVISAGVLFKGGVAKYKEGMDGIEFFALNSLLEGTREYPFPELQKIFVKEGILKRVIADHDYSALILKSPSKNYKKVIEILFKILNEPELNPQRIEVVRNNLILRAKRKEEEPDQKLFILLNEVFYKNHPYKIEPEGKIETLKNFKIEDIRNFLENNFYSGGIVLGFVGPLEKEEILNLFDELFGKIEKRENITPEIPDFSKKDTFFYIKKDDYETSYIATKFPVPDIKDRDYPAILALSEILSQRFEEKVRTKAGISYAVWAGASMKKKNYGYFYVSSSFPDSAWKLMMKEVNEIKEKGVKEKEIKESLNLFRTYRFLQNASTDGVLVSLFRSFVIAENPEFLDSMINKINEVKPEDIKSCANLYFKNFVTLKIGP
ncbi:MAG: pitrilysin family protein [candidate division WOR-3 bacterium]